MSVPVAFVLIVSILPACQNTGQADVKATVDGLVKQLDADEFVVRKAAREKLMKLGPAILPLLIKALPQSVEAETSLQHIRRQLRNQAAVGSLGPALVTLSGTFTVDQLADRISGQTGNPVSVAQLSSAVRGQSIAVRYEKEPFWNVVHDLAAKLKVQSNLMDGAVRFVAGEPVPSGRPSEQILAQSSEQLLEMKAYRVRTGLVTVKPLIGNTNQKLLRIPLSFGVEPRLRGLFLRATSNDVSVVTPTGEKLVPYSANQSLEVPISGRGEEVAWRHDVVLPANAAVGSVNVRGTVEVLMAAGYEPFRFRDLPKASGTRQSRTGVDLQINEVEIDDDRGNLEITMTVNWKRSQAAFDSYRTWQFHNEAWLQAPDNSRIDFSGPLITDGQRGGGVQLRFRFKNVTAKLADCVFVYEAPTALKTVVVPFEFKGVPLRP